MWKVFFLFCIFYACKGTPCTLCSFLNQTTNLSNCTESCGGGIRHYFHYVCCGNLTRLDCETFCKLNLTVTKSVKVLIGCNTFCNNGGTFQNDTMNTEMCLCPLGTTGRCCDTYVNDTTSNSTKFTSFSGTLKPTESRPKMKNATSHVTTEKTTTQRVYTTNYTETWGSSRAKSPKPQNIQTKSPSESLTTESTEGRKQGMEAILASTEAANTTRLSTAISSEGTQSVLNTTRFLTGNPIQNGKNISSSTVTSTKTTLNAGSNLTTTSSMNKQNYTDSSLVNNIVGSMTTKAPNPQNNHNEGGTTTQSNTTKQGTTTQTNTTKQETTTQTNTTKQGTTTQTSTTEQGTTTQTNTTKQGTTTQTNTTKQVFTEGKFFTNQSKIISTGTTSKSPKGTKSTHSKVDQFQEKPSRNAKKTLYVAVGVPVGVILIAVVISLMFYAWLIKRKRNHRVDVTNDKFN